MIRSYEVQMYCHSTGRWQTDVVMHVQHKRIQRRLWCVKWYTRQYTRAADDGARHKAFVYLHNCSPQRMRIIARDDDPWWDGQVVYCDKQWLDT